MTSSSGAPATEPAPAVCPHCPDGHRDPTSRPWGTFISADPDGDGRPNHIRVVPSSGGHVAESDAAWLWHLIRRHG